ncbi:MAG TPA: type II toxin-antitoxin system VapC family toxin [Vicinamibacterales bacterium]|nr:type II toxin-antitoxin system VapC family toxin [Vicinamibacterales bacterium]
MTFWDSSALVPLLVAEPVTRAVRALYLQDHAVAVWWTTPVECASAVARLERDGALRAKAAAESFRRLDALTSSWIEIEPVAEIREVARRLLRSHPLRTGDALQLAAAYLAAERRPATLALVTLDDRLAEAAGREGFIVVQPG